jgi:hypothetical protein
MKALSLVALVALTCSLVACSGAPQSGVKFAIAETSAARWTANTRVRVVDQTVNMMEPLALEAGDDGTVALTYARRGREGLRVVIDAESLASRAATPFVFADHPRRGTAPCVGGHQAEVRTRRGDLRVWADESSGRIFADGAVVSEEVRAFGQPVAAVSGDSRVIVAFFAETAAGFELVVAAFDAR